MGQSRERKGRVMFLFSDYWPQPKVGELAVFDFGLGADNKQYSFIVWNSGDSRHFYQEDYHDNKWQSTWHNDYFDKRGIVETADDYPKYSYQIWTSYRTTAFKPGKEILWGGTQEIGEEFNAPCDIDSLRSTKFEAPTKGNQRVKFCSLKKDILEIEYDQTWGDKPSTGWRAFHKKGVGITKIIWRYKGQDVGNPIPAKVNIIKGTIKNKYPVIG
jgi:hypothetical protein